jgi:hypothetical protein
LSSAVDAGIYVDNKSFAIQRHEKIASPPFKVESLGSLTEKLEKSYDESY